ncbi:hypothetical protein Tco_1560496, partial [Tanacetum coccineum]
ELTLRVGKEAVKFNLDQILRYSPNYDEMTANQNDVIKMACDEYSHEVLGFFDVIASGNPTPYYDLIVSTSSPTLPPSSQGNYLPKIQKELKICEAKNYKSSIDEPPEVELKDLPSHIEYAFLEGDDKFPVIIAKDLSVEEKVALIKMLKRCEDTNLCLNWEKSHFMANEGIVIGHKISKNKIEVDKAKVDVIAKLPHPTTVKGV